MTFGSSSISESDVKFLLCSVLRPVTFVDETNLAPRKVELETWLDIFCYPMLRCSLDLLWLVR